MFLNLNRISIPGKLSSRLTFFYTTTFVALLTLASTGIYLSLDVLLENQIFLDMTEDIEEFQQFYQQAGIERIKTEINRETANPDDQQKEFYRLYTNKGELFFASDGDHWNQISFNRTLFPSDELSRNAILETQHIDQLDFPVRVIYGWISGQYIIQAGETIESKEEILDMILDAFLLTLIIIIPIASFVSWWVANKSSQSIEAISHAVAEIEKGNFDSHADIKTHVEEINQLANTFNSMVDRIKSLITEMRNMIDNITHDLRSPLGRIRAISEDTLINAQQQSDYIRAAEKTLGECDRLLLLINTSLDVAEIEAGVYSRVNEEVDLSAVVADACELFEPVAHAKQLEFDIEIKGVCIIHGNLQNLQRMIANLIDNAIKYTPPKGHVSVGLSNDGESCRIKISDTGIGISSSDHHRVFDRFFRCDNSRSHDGCGLGLSFSRAVARQHGGDIILESDSNAFTAFTILLPE